MLYVEYPVPRETLEKVREVAYAVDRDDRISYANPAFDQFSAENGAPHLTREAVVGTHLWKWLPNVLLEFFDRALHGVRGLLEPWHHEYECSSPQVYRRYRMTVFPQPGSDEVVFLNSLVLARPHEWSPVHLEQPAPGCKLTMCCNCRRTRLESALGWVWVPEYVEKPPRSASHTVCPVCREALYGGLLAQCPPPQARAGERSQA